jgi:hypothetical protein
MDKLYDEIMNLNVSNRIKCGFLSGSSFLAFNKTDESVKKVSMETTFSLKFNYSINF